MTSLDRKTKMKKTIITKDGDGHQLRIDQEAAMRKFRRRQRSISVKTIDSQRKIDHKIPGTNFPSKSNSPWNKHGNIKRPMNAFMLFGRAYRPVMVQMFPGAPNSQISIYLGNIWRSMTWEQQKPFFEEAKRIRYRHQNDYPEWLYERDNQRSIKYIKKLREDYMIPRNQMLLNGDEQAQNQLCPSISVCTEESQVVLSNMNSVQETTDLIPEIAASNDIIVPVQGNVKEMFNEGDFQIVRSPNWGEDVMPNNMDFSGYVRTFSPLRDADCELNNEDNVEGAIQFTDQTSFDLQELWNLVEGNSPPTQNVDSQDCAEALSLVKMCDYEVKSRTNFDGSIQLGDQTSIDLQELWNLVENTTPPPPLPPPPLPPTQIIDSQDGGLCTWSNENVVSAEEVLTSSMIPMNPIEYTLWPPLDTTHCHVMHNDHRMETFPEHSVQFIVTNSPETLHDSGDVLPKENGNLVYVDSGTYSGGCETFCQADNVDQWWPSPRDPEFIVE